MHQASGAGNRKSPKRFSLLTFVLIGDTESFFLCVGVTTCDPRILHHFTRTGEGRAPARPITDLRTSTHTPIGF